MKSLNKYLVEDAIEHAEMELMEAYEIVDKKTRKVLSTRDTYDEAEDERAGMGMDAMNYLIRKAKTDNKRSFSMKEGKTLKEILVKSKLTEAATYFVVDTSTKQRKMVKDKLTKAEAEKLAKTNKNYKVSSYDSNPKTSDDWDDLYDSYQMDESKSYQVKYAKSKGDKIQVAEYDSEEEAKKFLAKVKKDGMNGIITHKGKPLKESAEWTDLDLWLMKESKTYSRTPSYNLYHDTMSGAFREVEISLKKMGYEFDPDDYWYKVSTGPKKPSAGKYNKYSINIIKDGQPTNKMAHVQIYGMDSGNYELNQYVG
jgi:glycerophosphoryl diester phosphodiesterase